MSRRRTSLLRRHAGFRWLWISRAISYVGDGIALVALVLHVQGTSGSGTAVAGLLLAAALPSLLGPVAGNVGGDTLIQRTVPAAMRGRVFGLTSTAAFLGSGLAYAAGGVLVDLVSPRAVFVAASVGVFAAAIGGVFLLPRDERT